jgi:hypothetical protein
MFTLPRVEKVTTSEILDAGEIVSSFERSIRLNLARPNTSKEVQE